ncbi:transcription factor GTE12-like isoform X2 [Primulina huaijiensis]|uniref:transcription factor GTE12-like isoform X2 n=1 Tax=Primulina huaijiensis TaxID=1492673 RepID=UPI003CC7761B
MTALDNSVKSRLKFKITSKGIRDESNVKPCQNIIKFVVTNGHKSGHRVTVVKDKLSDLDISVRSCTLVDCNKRRADTRLDGQRVKRQKMDHNVKQQCTNILKTLLIHRLGCHFSKPVDPVELNIPDYLSIITKPMDLGTIKRKLEGESYYGAQDFAADVRLTFSNAMLYNPPGNCFHSFAKELVGIFNKRWKLIEAKLKSESRNVENFFVDERNVQDSDWTAKDNGLDAHKIGLNKVSSLVNVVAKRPMSLEEKQKLRLEFLELSSREMTGNLRAVFQKFGLTINKERIASFFDAAEDETLWKLKKAVNCFQDTRVDKVKPAKIEKSGRLILNKATVKAKCSACATLPCHCRRLKVASALSISNEITLHRFSELDSYDQPDGEVKYPMESHSSKLNPGFGGSSPHGHVSTPASADVCGEGWTSLNFQMSPKKALRAAMLKTRFADTIFRATHQSLPDHGEKSDPVRMQQEKERMERQQREEKTRIEAEIKAVEEASRMRREKEREAARMAMQKMEKTVEINENQEVLNYLEMLSRDSPSDFLDGEGSEGSLGISRHSGNFLERLGLYIKDDYRGEEDDEILSGEEGEILS